MSPAARRIELFTATGAVRAITVLLDERDTLIEVRIDGKAAPSSHPTVQRVQRNLDALLRGELPRGFLRVKPATGKAWP